MALGKGNTRSSDIMADGSRERFVYVQHKLGVSLINHVLNN